MNLSERIASSLTSESLTLIRLVKAEAERLNLPLYIVGGSVRDLMLGSAIKDFDLTVEGDAIHLARSLAEKHGGKVTAHSKFYTATWSVNDSVAIDLISARRETYAHPGALPTVQRSHIEDDLHRRDFTVNAMAVRLDGNYFGELYDPLNGQMDLGAKLIRVLHAKSFVDDPTRIFRAIRYAVRYGFEIAPETLSLVNDEARGIFSQLSGERLRHEFDLIFEEENAVSMLEKVNKLNLLHAIHPALLNANSQKLIALFDQPEHEFGEFSVPDILSFRQTLGWILYLMYLSESEINSVADRLAFPTLLTKSVSVASSLLNDISSFKDWKPSQWTFHLDEIPSLAVYAVWLVTSEAPLREYLTRWQNVKPFTTGNDLKACGLEPGPRYAVLLRQLRAAWLNGEVGTEEEEILLLERLL